MSAKPTLSSILGSLHRRDHEPPPVISKLGWRYHHLGIPTHSPRPNEKHLEASGLHVSGFSTSPFGIEWMRYSDDSPLHPAIKTLAHVAFEVDDLEVVDGIGLLSWSKEEDRLWSLDDGRCLDVIPVPDEAQRDAVELWPFAIAAGRIVLGSTQHGVIATRSSDHLLHASYSLDLQNAGRRNSASGYWLGLHHKGMTARSLGGGRIGYFAWGSDTVAVFDVAEWKDAGTLEWDGNEIGGLMSLPGFVEEQEFAFLVWSTRGAALIATDKALGTFDAGVLRRITGDWRRRLFFPFESDLMNGVVKGLRLDDEPMPDWHADEALQIDDVLQDGTVVARGSTGALHFLKLYRGHIRVDCELNPLLR
jgi:hypothetical protein